MSVWSFAPQWMKVCSLEDILPETGVAARLGDQEIALFRVADAIHAIGNIDPATGVGVLARGIVGDLAGEIVVASPLFKQHYSLITGACVEDPALAVPTYPTSIYEGEVWVRPTPLARRRKATKPELVIIGNGMAATRTLEELLEAAPQAFNITVFGAEPRGGYSRVLLSSLLYGDKELSDIVTHPPEWYAQRGVRLHCGDPIVRIDRLRRRVHSQSGIETSYDRLVIATGSAPARLDIPGEQLPGVRAFRSIEDVEAMVAAAGRGGRAVVIGAGLLGLEAASGLARRGMKVSVVHAHERVMERQLDDHAAALLRSELEARGIEVILSARTHRLMGDSTVTAVALADGRQLSATLVLVAVGVRPQTALARAAGLPCERGILVDDTLATNDPAIYAVGECVQHRGQTFGLVAPLLEQARVCAMYLAERGLRGYRYRPPATRLKVSGVEVFSAGNHTPTPFGEALVLRDPKRGIYKRLIIERNIVRGVVLYGDTRDGHWYADLIAQGKDVGAFRDRLLFGEAAASC